jgi:mRNA interferase MazF
MPAETAPLGLYAGQIVLAEWRGDALPKEPNKRRPAVVVEDDGLCAPSYPNAILVPLTEDAALAIPGPVGRDCADRGERPRRRHRRITITG